MSDVGVEIDGESIHVARAHDQGVIAHEVLQEVNLAVVGPISRIGADHFSFLPDGLKIVFRDRATMAFLTERQSADDVIFRMRGGDLRTSDLW